MFALQSDHVISSISEASSSLSVLSLSPEMSVCSSLPDAVQVFYDNIVRAHGVGIWSSRFSYDSNVIVHLMKLHGIHCRPVLCLDKQQYILLQHLLVGDCFRSAEHNRSLVDLVSTSSAFPGATDMSLAFVWHIVEDISTDQKLTNRKLSALTAAFLRESYSSLPFSPCTHAKHDTHRLFMRVLKGESSYDDECPLPTQLEKMTKSELVVLARDHLIVFDRRMTVDELHTLVVSHILSASCVQSVNVNDWDDSPKGCARSGLFVR